MKREDLRQVISIERESFLSPYSIRFFEKTLFSHPSSLWVGVLENKGKKRVVGYIALRFRGEKEEIDKWMDIVSIAVASSARGRGIGRGLMQRAIREGKEREIEHVRLNVSAKNKGAMHLYNKLGFCPAKWILQYYSCEGEDAVEMHLKLRS